MLIAAKTCLSIDKRYSSAGFLKFHDLRRPPSATRAGVWQDARLITRSVENTNDLQWFGFVPIDDQVRIDQKEAVPFVG